MIAIVQQFLRLACLLIVVCLFASGTLADSVNLVSQRHPTLPAGGSGGGNSGLPIFSADGRYVVFASTAANLTLTNNSPAQPSLFPTPLNVYLRDRTNGTTTLVTAAFSGLGGANGDCYPRAVSTNGRFVLFESGEALVGNSANNLLPPLTNNHFYADIYVRDLWSNVTTLVSVNTNGFTGNRICYSSTMTPDGRYIAFASPSSDLVPGDTNGIPDIFVRDMVAGTTTLVSVGAEPRSGSEPTQFSDSPVISPDGRWIAFFSTATNLVGGVSSSGEVYLRDTLSNSTYWVSSAAQSNFLAATGSTNLISCNFSLSQDASYVSYEACTNDQSLGSAYGIVLRYQRQTGSTDLICTNAYVPLTDFQAVHSLDMTPDGRFIAFLANVGDSSGFTTALYVWDAQTGSNTLVSVNTNNVLSTNSFTCAPEISTNGEWVAFVSSATDLVTNGLNGTYHIYLRNIPDQQTQLVDVGSNGTGAGVGYGVPYSLIPAGTCLAYGSESGSLVTNDFNKAADVFVRDVQKQTNELISACIPAYTSHTPDSSSGLFSYSVSGNGRWVAFASDADDLVPGDTNELRDVFVRDLLTGSNYLVSADSDNLPGNGMSTEPSLSADGHFAAFSSYASNLVSGDTNNAEDVFIRDLQLGVTLPVSGTSVGLIPKGYNSCQPTLSADGRIVLFHAQTPVPSGIPESLLVFDRSHNTTFQLTTNVSYLPGVLSATMTPDGHYVAFFYPTLSGTNICVWNSQTAYLVWTNPAGPVSKLAISPDGNRVAWVAGGVFLSDRVAKTNILVCSGNFNPHMGLQFSGDGNYLVYTTLSGVVAGDKNGVNDVYLFNIPAATNTLVSHAWNSVDAASAASDSPVISADGRFIVYRSSATNLVAGVQSSSHQLFVYDRLSGTNSLLTWNQSGSAPAFGNSRTPLFSGDGHYVVFQSWAPDLTSTGDFNGFADLFSYPFLYLSVGQTSSGESGPVLTWPALPGQIYQVQYKNHLEDADWLSLTGTLLISGNQASLTNTPPITDQRFFRILAQ